MPYTHNDLLDAFRRHLAPRAALANGPADKPKPGSKALPPPPPAGRPFLTESVIKKALTGGAQHLKIPKNAIVSPLAQDWLALEGIRIIRSD